MESEMSLKRPSHGDDGLGVSVQETKRRVTFEDNIEDTMEGNSSDESFVKIKKIVRQVVGEELKPLGEKLERVEKQLEYVVRALLQPTARPSFNQAETLERRGLQLVFANKLPSPIFTFTNIKAEDGGPVNIELVDTTGTVVKTGPYSSIKIEIIVLDGEFCSDDRQDWSEDEFSAKVVRERNGKRPLVTGELNVKLKEGAGVLGNIVFTDNSSWTRDGKFGLGARVSQRSENDLRIKEGRSEAFVVKDFRGKSNVKHHPPNLDDEIWRLENISKDGKFRVRLTANGVHTVRDFLQWHTTNPTSLRNMLDCTTKIWNTIVEHATTCKVDDEKYYAYNGDIDVVGLVFNSIYQLVAATFDRKNYLSLDSLPSTGKPLVENVKKRAYEHVKDFVPIDAPPILGPSRPLQDLQAEPFSSSTSILQHPEFRIPQPEMQLDFNHASASTSYACEDSNLFQLSLPQNTPPIQGKNYPSLDNLTFAQKKHVKDFVPIDAPTILGPSRPLTDLQAEPSSSSTSILQHPEFRVPQPEMKLDFNHASASTSYACEDSNTFQLSSAQNTPPIQGNEFNDFLFNGILGQVNDFLLSDLGILSSFPNFGLPISMTVKARAAWCKIRAVIKWISVRRGLAA